MTALAAQFEKNGVLQWEAEFKVAIAKARNQGGSFERMRAQIDAAEAAEPTSGEGHAVFASHEAYSVVPSSRQPIPGEATSDVPLRGGPMESASSGKPVEGERGHIAAAQMGLIRGASPPSFNRGGEGQTSYAPPRLSSRALPVREPTKQQRVASLVVAKITVMDTYRIDGRPIGDWTVSEARKAGKLKTREGHILLAASRFVANAHGYETIRSVMKAEQIQKIIQKAAEVADAV